jgi:hypothetical protein
MALSCAALRRALPLFGIVNRSSVGIFATQALTPANGWGWLRDEVSHLKRVSRAEHDAAQFNSSQL